MHLPFSIHRCQRLSLMIVTMAALSSSAWGGIIVSFGTSPPNPMTAGGSGILDVFVRSDVGTQILDGFQVQVGLIPTGGSPVGGLIFSNLQLDAQLLIGGPGGGYVFFGNSLSQNTSSSIGAVSGAGSLYTGYDATDDGSGPLPTPGNPSPMLLTTTDLLLYRLNLSAIAAGTYDVTVNPAADPSFFTDQLDPVNTGISFSTSSGSLTVDGSTAVPEPSAIWLIISASVIALIHRCRDIYSPNVDRIISLRRFIAISRRVVAPVRASHNRG